MKVKILRLALLTIMLAMSMAISSVHPVIAENWQQFHYWNGYEPPNTSKFFLEPEHEWWQIRWHYVPLNNESYYLGFEIYIYKEAVDMYFYYEAFGTEGDTEGKYRFVELGRFMVIWHLANITYVEIWGEQDLDSIPEFPSFIILPVFMMITVLAVIVYKRKHQTRNKKREV